MINRNLTATDRSGTLAVPGAKLYFEIRGRGPLISLVGAPMDADGFALLAEHLATDHTVLTCDPRGIRRSSVTDRDTDSTPNSGPPTSNASLRRQTPVLRRCSVPAEGLSPPWRLYD